MPHGTTEAEDRHSNFYDARVNLPFDVIVLGAGSFGPVLATHLFNLDAASKRHRVLVLDGGKFLLAEHLQNLPPLNPPPLRNDISGPPASSIQDLRVAGLDKVPRGEVWGLPWHANQLFPGLAYCIGGRSLFFGGWSPQPIDSELVQWPPDAVADLKAKQWPAASAQIGTAANNDFIFGELHSALRARLFAGLSANKVGGALPVANELAVEAPLAVEARPPRAGFFPFNKFSSPPLLLRAARLSYMESGGDDTRKRLMVVPDCHVRRLRVQAGRVSGVEVSTVAEGDSVLPVPPGGVVVLALGTIESTRLALVSLPNPFGLMGRNLMAHLRTNLTIRIPTASLPALPAEVQTSALFVKGGSGDGHFHVQITASGISGNAADSEAELWKKIPDLDWLQAHALANDDFVVITLRGIGEMFGDKRSAKPASRIELDPETDEFGVPRAIVSLGVSGAERALWQAMDQAILDLASVFAGGGAVKYRHPQTGQWQALPPVPFEATGVHDTLGTTHHEAGTLWMGADPAASVTDSFGRFHAVPNAYVAGPALFPQTGSPNPMLTAVALARRTAEALA